MQHAVAVANTAETVIGGSKKAKRKPAVVGAKPKSAKKTAELRVEVETVEPVELPGEALTIDTDAELAALLSDEVPDVPLTFDMVEAEEHEEQVADALEREAIARSAVIPEEEVSGPAAEAARPARAARARSAAPRASASSREILIAALGEEDMNTWLAHAIGEEMRELDDGARAAATEVFLNDIDKLAKKVREKVLNLLLACAGKTQLSAYTQRAITELTEKGELTSKTLRENYLSRPYSPGTAAAQTSQLMAVLPFVGIAQAEGKVLKPNASSQLLQTLSASI